MSSSGGTSGTSGTSGINNTVERALTRWAEKPPAARDSTDVLGALAALGDALRLGLEIPSRLREWMSKLERADVEAALEPLARELSHNGASRREEAESARRAVIRIAMSRGWSISSVMHLDALALPAAEKIEDHSKEEDAAVGGGAELEPMLAGSVGAAVPDDDIVLAYVHKGALARYVEGVAERNPAFKEELTACIDALIEAGETVGETARRWRRSAHSSQVAVARANVVPIGSASASASASAFASASSQRRWGFVGSLSLAASLLVCVGGYSIYRQRESERMQAVKDRELADRNAQIERLMLDLKREEEAVAAAQAESANAKSEADRMAAQAKLSAAQEQQRRTQANVQATKAGSAVGGKNVRAACTCQAGDPLCSCL